LEFDRVDAENKSTVVTYRQKASRLEADLAGARGRLGAVEESLSAFRQRCIQPKVNWRLRMGVTRLCVRLLCQGESASAKYAVRH
jgi:hypothetical protein